MLIGPHLEEPQFIAAGLSRQAGTVGNRYKFSLSLSLSLSFYQSDTAAEVGIPAE